MLIEIATQQSHLFGWMARASTLVLILGTTNRVFTNFSKIYINSIFGV